MKEKIREKYDLRKIKEAKFKALRMLGNVEGWEYLSEQQSKDYDELFYELGQDE